MKPRPVCSIMRGCEGADQNSHSIDTALLLATETFTDQEAQLCVARKLAVFLMNERALDAHKNVDKLSIVPRSHHVNERQRRLVDYVATRLYWTWADDEISA